MFDMRITTFREMVKVAVENPDLSVGEVLYSVLRPKHYKNAKHIPHDIKFLRELSDESIMSAVEKALQELKETK